MRNLVGFENYKFSRTGCNYVTPMFIQVDGTESMFLQDMQMDETIDNEAADIQVLDEYGLISDMYYWYKKDEDDGKAGPDPDLELCDRVTVPEGKNGLWFLVVIDDETGDMTYAEYAEDVEFTYGDSFQLTSRKNKTVTFAGQVSDVSLAYKFPRTGCNYIGNPFPTDIDIQDVQMDETIDNEAADIQVLDEYGLISDMYYWYKKDEDDGKAGPDPDLELCDRVTVPEGKNGLWFLVVIDDETGDMTYAEYPDGVTFASGDGFQLTSRKNKFVYITCPYEL